MSKVWLALQVRQTALRQALPLPIPSSPLPRRPLQRVQAALAARRYFLGQQTKSQIADELGVSRFKVARLIDAAIEQKIVQFIITEPDDLDAELGEAVRNKYELKAVLVWTVLPCRRATLRRRLAISPRPCSTRHCKMAKHLASPGARPLRPWPRYWCTDPKSMLSRWQARPEASKYRKILSNRCAG